MKFQNLLQQMDYSLVLPNETLMPLALILQKEKNIFSFFKAIEGGDMKATLKDLFLMKGRGAAYPKIKDGKLPQNLVGSDIIKGGGHFTGGLLSNVSGKASLNKAKTVLFSFKNATEKFVNHIQLDEYLQFATLNEKTSFSEFANKGQIFVVLSALISNELSLKNADDFNVEGNVEGNLDAQTVANYAQIKASATYSDNEIYEVSSTGVPLIFAIKTARILFKNNKFCIKPTTIEVRHNVNEENVEFLKEGEELIFE